MRWTESRSDHRAPLVLPAYVTPWAGRSLSLCRPAAFFLNRSHLFGLLSQFIKHDWPLCTAGAAWVDKDTGWLVRARFMHICRRLPRVSAPAAPWCLWPLPAFMLNVPQLSAPRRRLFTFVWNLQFLFPGFKADYCGESGGVGVALQLCVRRGCFLLRLSPFSSSPPHHLHHLILYPLSLSLILYTLALSFCHSF